MLNYDPQRDVWHCEALWMSDATFKRYVTVWFEGKPAPTQEQVKQAVLRCRRIGYWQRYGDPDVHFSQRSEEV